MVKVSLKYHLKYAFHRAPSVTGLLTTARLHDILLAVDNALQAKGDGMIKGKHYAFYGATRTIRMFCEECKDMTLVVDNKKLCCGGHIGKSGKGFEYMIPSMAKRHKPSTERQKFILQLQNNKCLYCNKPFGTMYVRKGKLLFTSINFDHLVPYSYTQSCKDSEFVGACNICNNIKSNKLFETVEEVFYYVEHNRKKKGYYYPDEKEINDDLPIL